MSISFVQRCLTISNGTNGSSNTGAVNANTTAGNLLVLMVQTDAVGNNLTSVSDSQSNPWQVDIPANNPGSACLVASCVSTHALTTAASDTVTPQCASTGIAQWAYQILEFSSTSGWNSAAYVDGTPVSANQSGTALSISGTNTKPVSVAVAGFGYKHGVTPALTFTKGAESTASFTTNKSSGQFDSVATEYLILAAAAAQTFTGTLSASSADTCAGSLVFYYDKDSSNSTGLIIPKITVGRRYGGRVIV